MYSVILRVVAEKRLRTLKKRMEEENLDGIILFSDDNIAYKLSLTSHFNIVLIMKDNVYILVDPTLYPEAVNESPWEVVLIKNFVVDEIVDKISSLLQRPGSEIRIGINKGWGRNGITFLYSDVLNALELRSISIVDTTPLLVDVFDKPYNEEIPIIKWISDTCSKALEAVEEYLKPGMREYEVVAIIDKILDENGVVDRWFTTIVASGPRAATPHAKTSNRRIREGDPVIIDIGPFWMGYDGCVAHTFIIGRNRFWENMFEKLNEIMRLSLENAKPGIKASILDTIPRREFRKHGLPDYPHLTGHPIGGFYKPVIADFVNYVLEPNMVFAYEPAIYIPGKGGIRIEPHIRITMNDYEVLIKYHKEILGI